VWSRDGRWLAYMSQRGPFSQYSATRVVIQAADGSERAFRHDFRLNMSRLAWSPDGRTVAVRGLRDNVLPRGVFGIHLIDRDTGRLVKTLSRRAPAEQFIEDQIGDIDWIDGSSIVFSSQQGLRVMDIPTGEDRLIWQPAPGEQVQGMSLSPDAARIAMTVSGPDASWSAIRVMPASGSAPHELLRVSTPQVLWLQTWTADGQAILTTRWDRSVGLSARRERLWRVSYDGTTASPLSLALAGLNEVRAHPDGRRVVFSAGAPQSEFWVTSGLGR
jgi:Tol biopolymer transport system component